MECENALAALLQEQARQRRQHQLERLIEAVRRDRLAVDAAAVAGVAAAEGGRIAVEQFGVIARLRNADCRKRKGPSGRGGKTLAQGLRTDVPSTSTPLILPIGLMATWTAYMANSIGR
jgi:hypothetical protein